MRPVQSTLERLFRMDSNFKEQYEKIKKDVLNHNDIKAFLRKHPELTNRDIEKNLIKLYEYSQQSKRCEKCKNFESCINTVQGYQPILTVLHGEIHLSYEKCQNRLHYESQLANEQLIQSLYMPRDILKATVAGIDQDDVDRDNAIMMLSRFLEAVKTKGLPKKGIYFHGSFGIGKTYFLGAVANFLKEYKYSSMLIYMPEFVREMKNSINDGTINEKIERFKTVDVLMLDDIGAETQSAWFRDEILGSILQYRMMEGLPVFFTSNFNLKELETELAVTRGKVEEVKAMRIIERIKQVSAVVEVIGKNKRR